MTELGLLHRLEAEMDSFTQAEQLIANFMLTDRNGVPFETAVSLAEKLGISSVTVGRFCRTLGYRNFRDLKAAFKFDAAEAPFPRGAQLGKVLDPGAAELKRDIDLNVNGLIEVYRMAQEPEWEAIVDLLVDASQLHIIGFQTERGIAAHFAHLLQYVRPEVHELDLAGGSFAAVLADPKPGICVVIVETRRYSRQAEVLARKCGEQGIAVVVVTDKYCHWARRYTPYVLPVPTESAIFWMTMVPLLSALTLLANGVVTKLGVDVEHRLSKVSELYKDFVGHVGQSGPRA